MKKCTKIVLTVMIGLTIALNLLAWKSMEFCDFYVENIFPVWHDIFGSLTDLSSKSVGEIMIALFVILFAAAVILGFVAVIFFTLKCVLKNKYAFIKTGMQMIKRLMGMYYRFLLVVIAVAAFISTFNYTILYHCSTFRDKYLSDMLLNQDEYSVEELAALRDYVVTCVNDYSKKMQRDENGVILYEGNMEAEAVHAMQALGEIYPQLKGYYTTPKQLKHSEFISQQYMRGYYFPFSMEANYNGVMYIMQHPSTMCHELAHTKGFIYEDEANLISFLACINSEDIVFQYSGYLSVLTYIDNDFKESINDNRVLYNSHVRISNQVKKDNVFLTKDAWTNVEKKAVVKTETVKKASNTLIESNLVLNGVEEGKACYCEVVGLLMDYYTCSVDGWMNEEEYMAANQ